MTQALTLEQLKVLSPCSKKYLDMFGEHESLNIEQAFDAGFSVRDICWLMGALDKRKEIIEFANFCAKQVEGVSAVDDAYYANYWADRAANADRADYAATAAGYAAFYAATAAADYAYYARATKVDDARYYIRKEQEQFLKELLK